MVERGQNAVAGLKVCPGHGDEAGVVVQRLEAADAPVGHHKVEAHVVAHQMAEQVDVFLRKVQAAQYFARYLGTHAVVLVVRPDAVEILAGVELAHIVKEHGHGAKPVVVKVFFRVVLHAL